MFTQSISAHWQKLLIGVFLCITTLSYAADEVVITTMQVVPGSADDASGDNPQSYSSGDTVLFNISVTNTGADTAEVISITDNPGTLASCEPELPAMLAQGEQINCSSSYVLQDADLAAGVITSSASVDYQYLGESQTVSAGESVVLGYVDNTDLPMQCGIDIIMVIDSSGSIGNFEAIDDMAVASKSFANAFSNTGTRMAITSYAWEEDSNMQLAMPFVFLTPTTVAAGGVIDQAIGDGICSQDSSGVSDDTGYTAAACSGGATNWEAGLMGSLRELGGARADRPQLVVHLTDGSPNMYLDDDDHTLADPNPDSIGFSCSQFGGCPTNVATGRARAVTDAVDVANQIKATGAHMYAIGVGGALSELGNSDSTGSTTAAEAQQLLIDSSGSDVFIFDPDNPDSGTLEDFKNNAGQIDVILVKNFADLEPVLHELALSMCSPSLTITKIKIPVSTGVAEPAEGVAFSITPEADEETYSWVQPDTIPADFTFLTDSNGLVQSQWTAEPPAGWEAANGIVNVDEFNFDPVTTAFELSCQRTDQAGSTPLDPTVNLESGQFSVPVEVNDIVTCEVINREIENPSIALIKDHEITDDADMYGGDNATQGDEVTYTFAITNDGNVPLTMVTLADPMEGLSPLACLRADDSIFENGTDSMAVAEVVTCSATYTVTADDVANEVIENLATVTGTPPNGPEVEAEDPEDVPVVELPDPSIDLIKDHEISIDADMYGGDNATEGDEITYTFTITNDGNVDLTMVTLSDPMQGLSALSCQRADDSVFENGTSSMVVAEVVTCSATYTVTADDVANGVIENLATVTGTPPTGPEVEAEDPEDVPVVITPDPSIDLDKTHAITNDADGSGGPEATLGDEITYSFTITNDGNVALSPVLLSDPLPGLSDISCSRNDGSVFANGVDGMAVNEVVSCSTTYTVAADDVTAGNIHNLATVTGTPEVGDPVTDDDPEDVPVVNLAPLQGCTPGYWKQSQHFGNWQSPVTQNTSYSSVFGVGPNVTLLAALGTNGGQEKALRRHAAAAYLNSLTDINYTYSSSDVISMVQSAYANGNYNEVKNQLNNANEEGCPLGNAPLPSSGNDSGNDSGSNTGNGNGNNGNGNGKGRK